MITSPINESQVVTLRGNVHPLAQRMFDVGVAPPDLPLNRMMLVLKRDPMQDYVVRKLIDDQQDKNSPNYHKWLTPTEYGAQFGAADQDIQLITGWLQTHGFQINQVSNGRNVIEFSGVEAQVEQAFHTQIHQYALPNGEQHWANSSDPQIPAALAPAVAGVWSLHNFEKKTRVKVANQRLSATAHVGPHPQFTSGSNNALAPADFYKIYNISPQFGGGPSIAVVARTNINVQDIVYFHYWTFDQAPSPNVIINGPDPGDLGGGEEVEAVLDTTWSGAVAPSAWIWFVVSASTNTTDGVDLSEAYIIDNNIADVMTESFGDCEAHYTSAQAAGIAALAQQAAAEGITYLVASGDSGAEGCDDPNKQTIATQPPSVNILASSPYTIAVGGTMFNENGHNSTYWSSSTAQATLGSALSYIPEVAWNQSCSTAQCGTRANIWAGGGGKSMFFSKPSWQAGVAGIPNDGARDLPDVALTAATHDPYLLCVAGSCVPDSQGFIHFYAVGGTSASTPAFAGIMAMVGGATGSRQGQANYVLYRLAANENFAICNGSSTSGLPNSSCIFNDVTSGNNAVPGETGYGTSSALYQTSAGYDLATGLGSVNVTNLLANWKTVTFNATSTTFSISPTTTLHGSPLSVSGTVTSNSSTGAPTGPVWLVGGSPHGNLVGDSTVDLFNLGSQGSYSGITHLLPGGTYQVSAHYAGDGTYGPSDSSPPVQVTIQPEPTTLTFSVLTLNATGNLVPFTTAPYGTPVYLQAHLSWASGYGQPSSYVNFWDNGNGIYSVYLDSQGNGTSKALTQVPAGAHSITGGYYGDNSFSSSTNLTPVNFSLGQVGTNTTLTSQQTSTSLVLTATVAATSNGMPASGLVTFSSANTVLGTAYLSNGSATNGTVSASATFDASLLQPGQYSVVASYAGDTNYTASNSAQLSLNLVADFAIANRGITSQTVSPGGTAQYINDLGIASFFGYSSTVTVACSVNAPKSSCTVSPTSYPQASGIGTVTVTTTAPQSSSNSRLGNGSISMAFVFPLFAIAIFNLDSRRRCALMVCLLTVLLGLSLACGGGSGGGGGGGTPGTPSGTYTVTVTGSSGSLTHSTSFTLIVQ